VHFVKAGMSDGQLERDTAECWDYALNSPEGRAKANVVNGARIIGGGVVALASMAAEKDSNKGDPKKDLANWAAHADCLEARGYRAVAAGG
jgi:hypothetical protein